MRLLSDFMLPDLEGVFFYPYLIPDLQSTVDVQMVRLINDPDSLEAKEASQWVNRAAEVLGDAGKRRLYVHAGSNYAAFEAQRTGLDDPEDLKRLLRGAGVLEFRIAVRDGAMDVPVTLLREQLAERGPNNTDSPIARWFAINDLKQWTDEDKPETLEALLADPVSYFKNRYGLVAAEKDGKQYVLLYVTPEKSMTHTSGDNWAIKQASQTIDDLGRPAVSFGLDSAGGSRMRRLTSPNVNQPMAIVLDGEGFASGSMPGSTGGSCDVCSDESRGGSPLGP